MIYSCHEIYKHVPIRKIYFDIEFELNNNSNIP